MKTFQVSDHWEEGYLRYVVEAVSPTRMPTPTVHFRSRAEAEAEVRRLGGLLAGAIASPTDTNAPAGPYIRAQATAN